MDLLSVTCVYLMDIQGEPLMPSGLQGEPELAGSLRVEKNSKIRLKG